MYSKSIIKIKNSQTSRNGSIPWKHLYTNLFTSFVFNAMPYTTNPFLPKLRAKACFMVRHDGKGVREVARHIGVSPGTLSKWLKKYPTAGAYEIPTESSRPKNHPAALDEKIVTKIVALRKKYGRCAEVIHKELVNDGVKVSLSSVKRTLDRKRLTKKRSLYKKPRVNSPRPYVALPGDLVQMDTIHLMTAPKKRIYVYTLIDLYSRWAYAFASAKIGAGKSVDFVRDAQQQFPHSFQCLQSDNGPEFSPYFTKHVLVKHRHSRIKRPNDNAHIERFNRTLQEECLNLLPRDVGVINRALPQYLRYYNTKRLHMGIDLNTPQDFLEHAP